MMHADHQDEFEYLQMFIKDAVDRPLEVSKNHLLYLSNNKIVRAQDVQVGDRLKGGASNMVVADIQSVRRQGLYAPATEDGKIWVSDVTASCYVSLLDIVPSHVQALWMHMALSPLRMTCSIGSFSICQEETYSEDGYSTNLLPLVQLGLHMHTLTGIFQLMTFYTLIPLLLLIAGLEIIIGHGLLITLSLGFIVAVSNKHLMIYMMKK